MQHKVRHGDEDQRQTSLPRCNVDKKIRWHVRTPGLQEADAHEPLSACRVTLPPCPETMSHQVTHTASEDDK